MVGVVVKINIYGIRNATILNTWNDLWMHNDC